MLEGDVNLRKREPKYNKGDRVATYNGPGVVTSVKRNDYDSSGFLYSVELDKIKGATYLYGTDETEPRYRIVRRLL